jgi:hypothetical protein
LPSSTGSQELLDEFSAVHFFVGFKLAQAFGFWPALLLQVGYEVLDPYLHAPQKRASATNTAGDLLVGAVSSYLGARHRIS